MKRLLASFAFVLIISFAQTQSLTSTEETLCQVQVAYAVSEGDLFGEYSITELLPLQPGQTADFSRSEFVARRLYSKVQFDEMFIVRFEPTGITHFLDATADQGYERVLVGGCSLDQRASFEHEGRFYIDASAN